MQVAVLLKLLNYKYLIDEAQALAGNVLLGHNNQTHSKTLKIPSIQAPHPQKRIRTRSKSADQTAHKPQSRVVQAGQQQHNRLSSPQIAQIHQVAKAEGLEIRRASDHEHHQFIRNKDTEAVAGLSLQKETK
jgi:hypothetical protein